MEVDDQIPNLSGEEPLPTNVGREPVRGVPKSGRPWKTTQKKPNRALVTAKPLHTSWEKKMALRQQRDKLKEAEKKLKENRSRLISEKKKQLEERERRRLANERRGEITQTIKNTSKLKRMKKKQLRMIRKADTTVVEPIK